MLWMRVANHDGAGRRLWRRVEQCFENANRAPAGEKPQFEAKALHVLHPNGTPWYVSAR